MENPGVNDNFLKTDVIDKDDSTQIMKLRGVAVHADTPSGAAWARKYEHPPAPTGSEYCGIPDINNSPSYRTEYRAVANTQTYTTFDTTTINYNKVLFLQTAFAEVPAIPFKYDTAGLEVQLPQEVIHNPSIDTRQFIQNSGAARLAYKSGTYDLNANDFNNQGTCTVAKFRPNVSTYSNTLEFLAYVKRRASKQLEKIAKQLKAHSKGHGTDDAAGDGIIVINIGSIPVTSTDVAQLSPNSTVVPAKQGAFVVQQFSQPTTPYVSTAIGSVAVPPASGPAFGRVVYLQVNDPSTPGDVMLIQINDDFYASTGNTALEIIACFDMCFAWILFEGLSVQPATSSAVTVTPPYITSKHITGLEADAYVNSVLLPFKKNCAVVDEKALRFAAMAMHSKADSLPAKFNSWGAIGSALLSAAPSIISTITNLFSKEKKGEAVPPPEQKIVREDNAINATMNAMLKRIERMDQKINATLGTAPIPAPRTSVTTNGVSNLSRAKAKTKKRTRKVANPRQ